MSRDKGFRTKNGEAIQAAAFTRLYRAGNSTTTPP